MELCLKAVLKAVGIDYPKVHDVSYVLEEVRGRFPPWFQSEIPNLAESSTILVLKRELSFYGGEEAFLSPEEVIGRADAEDAITRASRTFDNCDKLLEELRERLKA